MPINYNQQTNPNLDYQGLLEQLGRDREFINNYQQVEPSNRYKRMLQQELAYQAKDNGIDFGKLDVLNPEKINVDTKAPEVQSNKDLQDTLFNSYLQNKYGENNAELANARALEAFSKTYLNNETNNLTNLRKGIGYTDIFGRGNVGDAINQPNPIAYSGSINLDNLAKRKGITTSQVNVAKRIVELAESGGVDARALLAIAYNESGLGKRLINPYSGAKGTFQFMPGTWKQWGKGDPLNTDNNINAVIGFTKSNINEWKRKMGTNPNYREIYLMHFLGAGDGSNGVKSRGAIYALRHPNEKMPDEYCEQNNFPKGSTWQDAINRTYSWSDKALQIFL